MKNFVYRAKVSFSDTDAAGIVHFSNILRYVERAEEEWLKSFGMAQFEALEKGGFTGFPKVSVKVDYKCPLLPGDEFVVEIVPGDPGVSSLPYDFVVKRVTGDDVQEAVAATGRFVLAFAEKIAGSGMKSVALPDRLLQALRAAE